MDKHCSTRQKQYNNKLMVLLKNNYYSYKIEELTNMPITISPGQALLVMMDKTQHELYQCTSENKKVTEEKTKLLSTYLEKLKKATWLEIHK